MQYTSNLNLKKPDTTDYVNVSDLNDNMDIIDQTITEISDSSSGIEQQLTEHLADDASLTKKGHVQLSSATNSTSESLAATPKAIKTLNDSLGLHTADLVRHGVYGTATGTNALTMSIDGVPVYVTGMLVAFKNTTANTGAVTLNINGLGAKSIKKANGNNLSAGNLKAGGVYQCRYDGTNFMLLGEGGEYGTATAAQVLIGYTYGTEEGIQNGSMPNHGAVNQPLNINGTYTIPEGYHNGSGRITQNIPTKGAQTYTPGNTNQIISSGQYLADNQTILGDTNLIPSNIKKGINIFGVDGTVDIASLGGMKYATGNITSTSSGIAVRGIAFTPKYILIRYKNYENPNTAFAAYGDFLSLGDSYNLNAAQQQGTVGTPSQGVTIVAGGFNIASATVVTGVVYNWIAFG